MEIKYLYEQLIDTLTKNIEDPNENTTNMFLRALPKLSHEEQVMALGAALVLVNISARTRHYPSSQLSIGTIEVQRKALDVFNLVCERAGD